MKIYTKTGDNGTTSLCDGTRVSKCDRRIACCGTIDELTSYIGLVRDTYPNQDIQYQLLEIQKKLFSIGSEITVTHPEEKTFSRITHADIDDLEKKIDIISSELSPIHGFIIPGGHPLSSYCQIARTVCRRAEREIYKVLEETKVQMLSTIYINRLSDYLFVLARKALKDFNKNEISLL